MQIRRKRLFSLLEILIAMTIAMGVLITGLYFYRYAAFMDLKLKKEEQEMLRSRVMASRFSTLFGRLKKGPFFTMPEEIGITTGASLIFGTEAECYNPIFHGKVLARLMLDPEKRLLLVVWSMRDPKNTQPEMHLEVLRENVEGLEFEFLVGENLKEAPELAQGALLNEWRAEYQGLPMAIKIRLKGDKPLEWGFPIGKGT